jgi:uncharacterized protein
MKLTDKLNEIGTHSFLYPGIVGQLEVELMVPDNVQTNDIAFLGHPHSLHGGTMHNKVVTTLVRAFGELGIASIRFNFRGVGQTAGVYDAGIGESDDMLLLARQWLEEKPLARVFFAGFSFGSYVAFRAACQCPHALLITIAPPIHHFDYKCFINDPSSWLVVQGSEDDIVPESIVLDFVSQHPAIQLLSFAETGHFFHGKLILLKQKLMDIIRYEFTQ